MDDVSLKSKALSIIRKAESMRFRYQELHQELFSSIHWSAGWKSACEEGLPPAALAVEPPVRPLFKALRHWSFMKLLNRLGGAWQLGFRAAYLPIKLSPGLCLLATTQTDRTGIIDAGRALERLWLRATAEKLAVQPFAAAGIYIQGHVHINEHFQHDAENIRSALNLLSGEYHAIMFLRLGHKSGATIHRSGRRSQQNFVKKNDARQT